MVHVFKKVQSTIENSKTLMTLCQCCECLKRGSQLELFILQCNSIQVVIEWRRKKKSAFGRLVKS